MLGIRYKFIKYKSPVRVKSYPSGCISPPFSYCFEWWPDTKSTSNAMSSGNPASRLFSFAFNSVHCHYYVSACAKSKDDAVSYVVDKTDFKKHVF